MKKTRNQTLQALKTIRKEIKRAKEAWQQGKAKAAIKIMNDAKDKIPIPI